jgi:hypothetical protein
MAAHAALAKPAAALATAESWQTPAGVPTAESARSPDRSAQWLAFLAIHGIHPKLAVSNPGDPDEREADAIADRVMRMSDPQALCGAETAVRSKCAACDHDDRGNVARKADPAGSAAPPGKAAAFFGGLGSGVRLPNAERAFFEPRFGRDLSSVRIHDYPAAADAARAIGARAFAIGSDIAFARGEFRPGSTAGRRLLAHELAHTFQATAQNSIHRFEASEVARIASTQQDMLGQIRALIDAASTSGNLDMNYLVEISGGSSVGKAINSAVGSTDPTIPSQMVIRYIYTCRCGLLDMRHFVQLMYIAYFYKTVMPSSTGQSATHEGREHELEAESQSRFSPEDTPTNALGALVGASLPGRAGPDTVFNAIKDTLTRCAPVDWSSLSKASQDQIVQFHSDRISDPAPKEPGDLVPKNQNETAVPHILPVSECSGERSFPFELDASDSDRKTLSGKNFLGGSKSLTSTSDMRAFVLTQRAEIIKSMPLSEKTRFLNTFLSWPVTFDDKECIKKIYKNSTLEELRAEP